MRFPLDAYLARLGHDGPVAPTPDVLHALHWRHAHAIPFDTLDPYLRRPVELEPAALVGKLVLGGRGGWCFEQNALFRLALDAIGFRTTGLAARVRWNIPDDAVTPRSHMVLLVEAGGEPWLADVGFGGLTLTAPLRLVTGVQQETPHERFRLVHDGDALAQQGLVAGEWRTTYRLDLQPQEAVDYRLSNWWLCTHPSSHFLVAPIAARPDTDRRWALRGNRLTVHHRDGTTEQRTLGSVAELRAALAGPLRIRLDDIPELDAGLERVLAASLVEA